MENSLSQPRMRNCSVLQSKVSNLGYAIKCRQLGVTYCYNTEFDLSSIQLYYAYFLTLFWSNFKLNTQYKLENCTHKRETTNVQNYAASQIARFRKRSKFILDIIVYDKRAMMFKKWLKGLSLYKIQDLVPAGASSNYLHFLSCRRSSKIHTQHTTIALTDRTLLHYQYTTLR